MKTKYLMLALIVVAVMVMSVAMVSAAEPMKPAVKDKCPVCGMVVHPFPQWLAQIIFKDKTYEMFDGSKDMLRFYLDMEKYTKGKKKEDIESIYVTDYYTTKLVDANSVVFIKGSDVMGPMGKELVPVSADKVESFIKDHKGDKQLKFSEVTVADIPETEMHDHTKHDKKDDDEHGEKTSEHGEGNGSKHDKKE